MYLLQTLYRKHFTVKCGITATKNLKNVYRQTYFFNEVAYLFELVNILPSFVVFWFYVGFLPDKNIVLTVENAE